MRGTMWERFLIGLVMKEAAESGHRAEIIIVQSNLPRIRGAALSLTLSKVGAEHRLEHWRGTGKYH